MKMVIRFSWFQISELKTKQTLTEFKYEKQTKLEIS